MSIRRTLITMGHKLIVRYAIVFVIVLFILWTRLSFKSPQVEDVLEDEEEFKREKIREEDVMSVSKMAAAAPPPERKPAVQSLKDVRYDYAYEVKYDIDSSAPGEMGIGVAMSLEELNSEQKEAYNLGWKLNAFNQYASDMISLNRNLPDYRFPECKNVTYRSDLPEISVIIPFRDEAWSTLLRTVHSVINRTPPHLLLEIILSDDASTLDHLKKPLEDYIGTFPKVKLVRLKSRGGLIRTRLHGYDVSRGSAIIFLDSHCEVTKGWIEPLLDAIASDYRTVVTSVMDVIEGDDFRYRPYDIEKDAPIGIFDWRLIFKWDRKKYTKPRNLPVGSPTLIGCLIGVSRRFFEETEKFDEGFYIWGGENLEISFKAWMCGGSLVVSPCSHVGHVYKSRLPYDWGNTTQSKTLERNLHRLAETWLDEYIIYHKQYCGPCKEDVGDISGKLALKKKLNCKNFDWYIRNILPDMFIPATCTAYGEIRNKGFDKMCIDDQDNESFYGKLQVGLFNCHGMGANQLWYHCKFGQIRRHRGCFEPHQDKKGSITTWYCTGENSEKQHWSYREDNTIYHDQTNQCLEIVRDHTNLAKLVLTNCTDKPSQQWTWLRESPPGPIPKLD